MNAATRAPAVAGRFYPASPAQVRAQAEELLHAPVAGRRCFGALLPHAGWIYSGAIAGATLAQVAVPKSVVVLCPNHTGRGVRRSVWASGAWRIPGATVPIDEELARRIARHAHLVDDHDAHLQEHAIEVQLPLLHALRPDVAIVPICLGRLAIDECRDLGEGLSRAVREHGEQDVMVIASSDMSHYVPADFARKQDELALERVLAMDPEGLHRTVEENEISMCGYVPTTVALCAGVALGARRAELVRYGNSGERSGDFDQVVGYAGALLGPLDAGGSDC